MIESDWKKAEVICENSNDDFECGINEDIVEARYENKLTVIFNYFLQQ